MTKTVLLSFLLAFLTMFTQSSVAQSTDQVYFATDPAVSPDGQTVVFCYQSDLWKVPAKGGRAVRLTGMDGQEADPSISPNGKWLAFTSNQYGNNDVYVMPLAGGPIKRLTYHQASDQMGSWKWSSDSLYFESGRHNSISEYVVSVHGGTPHRVFDHYFNTVTGMIKAPDKPVFYFNESWQAFRFPERIGYRGPYNANIESYNTETKEFKKLTSWEGDDFHQMVDRTGNLYFVSDQGNGQFNLYTFQNGEKTQLTHFKQSVRNPSLSANGKVIAFEKEYQLFTYNTQTGQAQRLPISVSHNNTLAEEQSFNVKRNISNFDVSPDGKKIAFVSRGELFVSDIKGKYIRELSTKTPGRVGEVKWKEDSQTLVFNQTDNGYQNWFTISAAGSEEPKQLTSEHRNNRMLVLSPDRTKGVYLSGRNQLRLLDMKTGKSKTIVKDEFWGFQNDQPRFSPNGKWIAYTARRNFERDIFVYNIKNGKKMNLTNTGVSENQPFWGPSGDYIYFTSSRTQPSYPRGGGNTNLYRMALHPIQSPFKSIKYNELFNKKSDKDSTKNKTPINIQQKGLMQRWQQVGPRFGSQSGAYVFKKGNETVGIYNSNHEGGRRKLWKTTYKPFSRPKTKAFKKIGSAYNIIRADHHTYALSRGSIYKLNVPRASAKKIDISFSFDRNLKDEFTQMFKEAWADLQENYYNGAFNGVNWKEIRDRYAGYLPYVTSRPEFHRLVIDILGELNSSHVGFRTSGPDEKTFYNTRTLAGGLLFKKDAPYTVRKVVEHSPASLSKHAIKPGDQLISVNGTKVNPQENRNKYFTSPDRKSEMALTFRRGSQIYTTLLHPTSYGSIRSDLYNEWEDHNQQVVDKETNERVAYIHLKNMSAGALHKFLTQMISKTYHKDALILDLRYNTGGNVHDPVLHFLEQKPYLKWKYRDGKFAPQPNFAPKAKPIVLLVNHQTLSDGEVTAAAFKQLNLGTIIGGHTYKWIIFTSGKGLVDGSFIRLPSWGVYTLDGDDLEQTGVEPDIVVVNTFKDRLNGKDPQLQKAIQHIMKELK